MDATAGPPPSTCPIATAVANPTFRVDILPALQSSCGSATSTCHGQPPTGHVSYATGGTRTSADVYGDLVNQAPANAPAGYLLVDPTHVANSWIVEKVTVDAPGAPGNYGFRMPLAAPDLCAATVATLQSWIAQGAPY